MDRRSGAAASSLRRRQPTGRWGDRILAWAAWGAAGVIAGTFVWILGEIFVGAAPRLSWQFLWQAPQQAGRLGGIGPILVSTALILLVCLAVAVPIGWGAAIWLAELCLPNSRQAAWVRRGLEILAGVPSIVFGLFGNSFFCVYLGLGFSITSGGLTLAWMVLPLLIRTSEEGLRAVPGSYRLAAAALGLTPGQTLRRVLLPAAAPSLVVGLVLAVGRALAETAALIFTSGYVDRLPSSLGDSGRALSVHIYDLALNVAGGESSAYASAAVLVMALIAINGLAAFLTRKLIRRQWENP